MSGAPLLGYKQDLLVSTLTSFSFSGTSWYAGPLSEKKAEEALCHVSNKPGLFLVRDSLLPDADFFLSLLLVVIDLTGTSMHVKAFLLFHSFPLSLLPLQGSWRHCPPLPNPPDNGLQLYSQWIHV